ncbi:hypothetical protein IPG41_02435 [Candidatus Peregrinibacteria bacterium]|nr:MAG: hypothetical protein IPG41_02435 [Candidatus Peregrinibacteria bacterium]
MRLFALLILAPCLWMFSIAPIAFADTMNLGVCNFGMLGIQGSPTSSTGQALSEEVTQKSNEYETRYTEAYNPPSTQENSEAETDTNYCGQNNPATGMIEKGDCTSQVITEISEVVSSATLDGDQNEDRIINLYQGLCCLSYNTEVTTCYETRTFYTETLNECKAIENGANTLGERTNCQLQQWLIADTGMGILKLYVKQIFTFGAFLVGSMAVTTIILNGVRISATGVSGDISEAKQKITQALSGIILLFLSALILYSINPDFFG